MTGVWLNKRQLETLVQEVDKALMKAVYVEAIPRPRYPEQALEAVTFSVKTGSDTLREGILTEKGKVVAE